MRRSRRGGQKTFPRSVCRKDEGFCRRGTGSDVRHRFILRAGRKRQKEGGSSAFLFRHDFPAPAHARRFVRTDLPRFHDQRRRGVSQIKAGFPCGRCGRPTSARAFRLAVQGANALFSPYNTIWIKTLSNTAYKGSSMFFVVGLLYISLFYVFSFTSIFGVDLSINLHLVLITLFWVALIVFIVIAFPCFLLLSLKCINQIIVQLKLQQENDIRKEISILNNNILLKQLYINVLMNLDRTPNFPEKPLISSIISTGIGIINFFASTQACFSLIQMIKGI